MSLFTSVLKILQRKLFLRLRKYQKRFNKPWFSDTCKDEMKERNRPLERFEREPTEGNLNAYRIARATARRIGHSKKTSWRNYGSKINFKHMLNF